MPTASRKKLAGVLKRDWADCQTSGQARHFWALEMSDAITILDRGVPVPEPGGSREVGPPDGGTEQQQRQIADAWVSLQAIAMGFPQASGTGFPPQRYCTSCAAAALLGSIDASCIGGGGGVCLWL